MYRFSCVLLLCVSALQATPYKDCGSKAGHYSSITVTNCPESEQKCILRRNTDATIGIQFDVNKDVTAVKSVVHGILSGIPVPFPISHPDACADKDSGLSCPLSKDGGPYMFTNTLHVEKVYPKIPVTVKWELKDQDDEDIICIEIPAKIE